jgi:hypothetical protein
MLKSKTRVMASFYLKTGLFCDLVSISFWIVGFKILRRRSKFDMLSFTRNKFISTHKFVTRTSQKANYSKKKAALQLLFLNNMKGI